MLIIMLRKPEEPRSMATELTQTSITVTMNNPGDSRLVVGKTNIVFV